MLPGKVYRPEDVVRILRKRAWLVLVPWALVAAGTAVVARKLPDTYRSFAHIQVIPPRVPGTLVPVAASPTNLQDRLQAIQQNILSRTRLERLIQDFNLYEKERRSGEIMQDIVERMIRDIAIVPMKGDSFIVSYSGRDRRKVEQVTTKLSSFFIDESLNDGERRAELSSDFASSQVDEALRRLQEIEEREKQYKLKYATELPQQLASNQAAVQSTQQQLGLIVQSIEADTNTRLSLERQIADLEGADTSMLPGPSTPGTETTAAQRLELLERQLADFKLRGYSDTHPDMKRLQSAISSARKAAEAEALRNPVGLGGAVSSAELNRRKRLVGLQNELDDVKKRIVAKQADEKRLRDAIGIYQARVDRAPTRDAEMLALTREKGVLQRTYENNLNTREQANTAVNLQRRQIGEQFSIIDAARLPERPDSPNRPLINVFGIIGGLAVGLLLVAFIEYRDETFKTDTELGGLVSLPVLAVVPLMMSGKEQQAAFRQRIVLNAACGSAVLVCVALLTYTFVR